MFLWILLKYPFLRKLMLATLMTTIPLLNITQTQRKQKNMFTNGIGTVMTSYNFDHTILELNKNYVFEDHEKHVLCDSYIVEFVHDATGNYFERVKYCYKFFHVTKTPLFMLKVLKLLLFYLPMLITMFFIDLFDYKIPMHRKWVRLKCV